ncbi:DsbA family protein [Kitasatospora sp. NPDC057940]|uniref:DsbA family protein n=1 Tax=Kitasatospora sp. NPDC057940 TaxID=3346285 RepID=UPI0036DA062C
MSKPRRTPAVSDRARERIQRQRAAERARRNRNRAITGALATVVAAAVGVTIAVQSGKAKDARPIVPPAGAIGDRQLVIPVGDPDAPVTLTVYEDFRCPACAQVEGILGDTINRLEDEGKLRIDYHILSLVDSIARGKGSKNAANAVAAAQNAGKFREYHDVLFANHPKSETKDTFGDKKTLLALADKVKDLKTPSFIAAVNEGTHDTWVKKVQHTFDQQTKIQGTPAIFFEGRDLLKDTGHPLTAERLTRIVNDAAAGRSGTP